MGLLADSALTFAEAALAAGVREVPPGSNRGPEVDAYLRAAGLDPARGSYPWCAAFVTWCVQQAALSTGLAPAFRGSASTSSLLARNARLSLAPAELESALPCVFVHRDPGSSKGHTGFVLGRTLDGAGLLTLEGNTDGSGSRTGGCVMRHTRPLAYVSWFIRIA